MKVAGGGCIFQTTLWPSKQTLTFWRGLFQEGILHDIVGYLTLWQIKYWVQLNSPQIIALTCRNCPSIYFNAGDCVLGWSKCSLKNAPPARDFHWLLLQFCPAHGRSASYGYKSLLLHMYHLDVLQNYLQKSPQLRLAGADSSSCNDGLVLAH